MTRFLPISAAIAVTIVAAAAPAQVPPPPDPLSLRAPSMQPKFEEIEIEQKLGAQAPLETTFTNEQGQPVTLRELIDGKPAVLSFVYYECPAMCTQILNGMTNAFGPLDRKFAQEFNVITVSIDHAETHVLARDKKQQYLAKLDKPGAEQGWHFLTGDAVNIETLATAVGFRYQYDSATDLYAHASGIMVLTPSGQVSRYFYGIEYLPRDLNFALIEASGGKIGSAVEKVVLLCFAYDPATGEYGFWIMGAIRTMAGLILLGLVIFWVTSYLKSRKEDQPLPHGAADAPPAESNHEPVR